MVNQTQKQSLIAQIQPKIELGDLDPKPEGANFKVSEPHSPVNRNDYSFLLKQNQEPDDRRLSSQTWKNNHKDKPSNAHSVIGMETVTQKSIVDTSKLNKDLRIVFKLQKPDDYDDPVEKYIKE